MATEYTVRVHFTSGDERIVSAVNFHNVGEEGARSATALVDGREVPIYNRPEWDFLWYEQERRAESEGTALSEWAQEPALSECPYCHQLHDLEQIQLCPLNPKNVVQ
jgi:hypothetical protein